MKTSNSKSSKASYYRDFHKDIKDLLTKNYAQSSIWKIESKFKGPKGMIYLNPAASSDGKFSADVEYAFPDRDASVKVNVNSNNDVQATGSLNVCRHKAEVVLGRSETCMLSHECTIQEHFSSHEKITHDTIEVGFGVKAHPLVQIGCGASYTYMKKKECKWTGSCRIADAGRVLNIRILNGKVLNVGVISPIHIGTWQMIAAAEAMCDSSKKATGTVGIQVGSVFLKDDTVKMRTSERFDWAVSYVVKLADSWVATLTMDKNLKAGVIFTHS